MIVRAGDCLRPAHAARLTTQLYDRRRDEMSLDEVGKVTI
jgi:hypothetical protein